MLGRVVAVFVMLRLLHMDFASLAWANYDRLDRDAVVRDTSYW